MDIIKKLITSLGNWKVPVKLCKTSNNGKAYDCDNCKETEVCKEGNCEDCAIQECLNRLAEYEDTNHSPKKINQLISMNQVQTKRIKDLRELLRKAVVELEKSHPQNLTLTQIIKKEIE